MLYVIWLVANIMRICFVYVIILKKISGLDV
jgi:hypothetical protein